MEFIVENLYSRDDVVRTYRQVYDLLVTKHIINTYSTNKDDIRDIALKNLDLRGVDKILDLGCGYGFFIEKLKKRLSPAACFTGIDIVENNRDVYINSVASTGYKGQFINDDISCINRLESSSYNLVIASYSLYFFPWAINEISRVLVDGGIFVTVTHSRHALSEATDFLPGCMKKIGINPPGEIALNKLFERFSLENGEKMLAPYFKKVEKILYQNEMVFSVENIEDCIYYLEKKRHLIYKEVMERFPKRVVDLESCLAQSIYHFAKKNNGISLNKDDAVFRCYK